MRSALHTVALLGSIVALLAVPGGVSAKTPPHPLYPSAVSLASLVSCTGTGITGPTGNVQVRVYALKGQRPPTSAMTCARGIAVVKAGRRDLFSRLRSSLGATFHVQGASYRLTGFIGDGTPGLAPAFVGAKTVVLAVFASVR